MLISTDIGAHVAAKLGTAPAAASAGTRTSAAIDRQGFNSCVLVAVSGAVSGSPTAQTLDAKLQESDDQSTWSDVPGGAIAQITAANSIAEKDVNLRGRKRYIRVSETVGFTGGTSPTLGAASFVILGGADKEPV